MKTKTEQENFWEGQFGDQYTSRNSSKILQKNNDIFFKKIFKGINNIFSVLELGCNIGNNLISLKKIYKKSSFTGVEINKEACKKIIKRDSAINVINSSINNFKTKNKFDLVICKGVLIHIHPKQLKSIYKKIYNLSKKYILIAEYYSPTPVRLNYRGYKRKLFKSDFAGDLLSSYKKIKLLDYGFVYRYDKYPQDDINWFLLKNKNNNLMN
jgi:spore coat polysaccharide biosynthesis protein SpsF